MFNWLKRLLGGNNSQPQQHKPQLQTFILEPILTPSGLVDFGDDAPDTTDLDLTYEELDFFESEPLLEEFEEVPFFTIIFQIKGATAEAIDLDEAIAPEQVTHRRGLG